MAGRLPLFIASMPSSLALSLNLSALPYDTIMTARQHELEARAIGMENLAGTLEAGKKADMILFDPRHLKSFPNHNAEATVVYASSEENIDTTIVNGKIVYHRGAFSGGYSEEDLIREIGAEVIKMRRPAL